MPLSLDKSIRVEPYILTPDRSFPDITRIDLIATKYKCPTITVSPEYVDLISLMKARLNSKYNVIVEIDQLGNTFGLNKMLQKINYNSVDGCEIGLSKNKNHTELINEMKTICGFLKQFNNKLIIRWIINTSYGSKHIENCIKAIVETKDIKYDLVRLLIPLNVSFDKRVELGNLVREGIGMTQSRIKIEADPADVISINNVMFSMHASKL